VHHVERFQRTEHRLSRLHRDRDHPARLRRDCALENLPGRDRTGRTTGRAGSRGQAGCRDEGEPVAIFTFVVAGLFLLLSIEAGTFVDIPTNVLALLGISGGSYLVAKGVGSGGGGGKKRTTRDSSKS
jgi:hypothetical protein